VAGTQAAKANNNNIVVFKVSRNFIFDCLLMKLLLKRKITSFKNGQFHWKEGAVLSFRNKIFLNTVLFLLCIQNWNGNMA
jgi:hypothetical protein